MKPGSYSEALSDAFTVIEIGRKSALCLVLVYIIIIITMQWSGDLVLMQ